MTIETTWTCQCLVERLGEIGGGDDDDTFRLLETVELDQELIEGLLHVMLRSSVSLPRGVVMMLVEVNVLDPLRFSCFQ